VKNVNLVHAKITYPDLVGGLLCCCAGLWSCI